MTDRVDLAVLAQQLVVDTLDPWDYTRHFLPAAVALVPPVFAEANALLDEAQIERHPFFAFAREQRRALRIWVGQEAVVTGPFSQLLLLVAAQMENVHVRAAFMAVIDGEHGPLRDGVAFRAHPWLLHGLCESMMLSIEERTPLPPTREFLRVLAGATGNATYALGLFGVGNERMLIPEYGAIQACFDNCYADADYARFLRANIMEDAEHSRIIEAVALSLVEAGANPDAYLLGARAGVQARVAYYDALMPYL